MKITVGPLNKVNFNLIKVTHLSFRDYQQANNRSAISRLGLTAPVISSNLKMLPLFSILFIYSIMLINGIVEDACELNHLFSEGALSESLLMNVINFILHPVMNSHLLIGLCWLFFIFFPVRRAAIVLRKTALAFRETLQSFIGLNSHGCRAPPQING